MTHCCDRLLETVARPLHAAAQPAVSCKSVEVCCPVSWLGQWRRDHMWLWSARHPAAQLERQQVGSSRSSDARCGRSRAWWHTWLVLTPSLAATRNNQQSLTPISPHRLDAKKRQGTTTHGHVCQLTCWLASLLLSPSFSSPDNVLLKKWIYCWHSRQFHQKKKITNGLPWEARVHLS